MIGGIGSDAHKRMQALATVEKAAQRHYSVEVNGWRSRKIFSDPEDAVQFARRSAMLAKSLRCVFEEDGASKCLDLLATVEPSGQVDLTWRGSEIISTKPRKRERKT